MTHPSDSRAYFFKIDTTIKKIRSVLQKRFNDSGFDLTVDQWVLIDHVARNQGISQNMLAELTTKDAPTVTRILDLLVKKGLVERRMSDEDRRKFNIFLMPEGAKTFEMVLPVVKEIRRQGWGELNEEDYAHFVRIMDSIYQNFSE
ncbi:MarR family transcriptional regulator [Runella sp. CRIBMP]|uniref:MarR family transcriptional regulator n=1 Tax=Runella salmonicolor TaxID=2950278 RepID=A0ABT1FM12_9BACT|nr:MULTISPECIES: MarR family transcriptional regulator [Runella]MCP1382766.1 MarR family transcriptional regulator [Runella salmonicolor]NBB20809.1 MarR family transcriptional regulator [Runella sp. CRIBMP]